MEALLGFCFGRKVFQTKETSSKTLGLWGYWGDPATLADGVCDLVGSLGSHISPGV